MTLDGRTEDVMKRLTDWAEAGTPKPFKWDDQEFDFKTIGDEDLRRFVIGKIIEAGRQDGAKAERLRFLQVLNEIRPKTREGIDLLVLLQMKIRTQDKMQSHLNKCLMVDCKSPVASDEPFARYCADHEIQENKDK